MPERETNKPETTALVGQELLKFVEEAEFGSPEYQAISDYIFLRQSLNSLNQQQKNASTKGEDSEERNYWESRIRINENKIALLELQIHHNQSRIKGYDNAYTKIGIELEHSLINAARREAKDMYGDDKEKQNYYVGDIQTQYFDKIKDVVYSKRD